MTMSSTLAWPFLCSLFKRNRRRSSSISCSLNSRQQRVTVTRFTYLYKLAVSSRDSNINFKAIDRFEFVLNHESITIRRCRESISVPTALPGDSAASFRWGWIPLGTHQVNDCHWSICHQQHSITIEPYPFQSFAIELKSAGFASARARNPVGRESGAASRRCHRHQRRRWVGGSGRHRGPLLPLRPIHQILNQT